MKGEEELWFVLAEELHMSVQRCKQETTSTEFICWQIRRQRRINEFHREDYFLAQIACIVAKANSTKKIEFADFLMKFKTAEDEQKEENQKEKMEKSKAAWSSILGATHGSRNINKSRNTRNKTNN